MRPWLQLQPVHKCVPVPAVCLQLVTLVQFSWHDVALLHFCVADAESVASSWHAPPAQFAVHVAPELQISLQPSVPDAQFMVQVVPWAHTALQPPVDGQFITQVPVVHSQSTPATQLMLPELPPPPPVALPPPVPPVPVVPQAMHHNTIKPSARIETSS